MKTNYCYRMYWWEKDPRDEHNHICMGFVEGVTNSKEIMQSAFRQHPETLGCSKAQLSYYEL
jgi:hypothetical protein